MTAYNTTTLVSLLALATNNRETTLSTADTVVVDVDAFTFDDTTDGTPVDFDQGVTIATAHGVEGDGALFVRSGAAADLTFRLGDTVGVNKIRYTDSADAEIASLDSNGNLIVNDLTVNGTKTINNSEQVQVADNHIVVNAGYATAVAQTGGLVANYLPTATGTTTAGAGVFVAGVDAASDPTVTTSGSAFAAGDLVQMSGTANGGENDGIYEVVSDAAGLLTIRSTADGVTNQIEDFTNGQFVANAGDTGATITKITVSVLRAGTDGIWETGVGAVTGIVFSDLAGGGGAVTMDTAYNGGSAVAVDTGTVAWTGTITSAITSFDQNSLTTSAPVIDLNFDGDNYTGRPHGIFIDYGQATSYNNASDIFGIFLDGASNAGAGDLIGISIQPGWDQGIENGSSLVQTGAASFSSTFAHTGSTFDVSATGAVTIDSSAAAISIGADDIDQAINIGTAGERTTTIGNNVGAAGIALETGTGGLSLDADGNSAWALFDLTVTQDEVQTASGAGNLYAWTAGQGSVETAATVAGGIGGTYSATGGLGGSSGREAQAGIGGVLTFTGGAGGENTYGSNLGTTSFGGAGGAVDLVGGGGGNAQGSSISGSTTGAGGAVAITGGLGGEAQRQNLATASGAGGAVAITGGLGGGALANTVSALGGTGGAVDMIGGAGGVPAAGSGTDTGGDGGGVSLCGGGAGVGAEATGDGGDVTIKGGDGATDGAVNIGATTTSAINIGNTSADLTITALDVHLDAAGEVTTNDQPNAATGGVTAGQVIYLSASNTVDQADASTEAAAAVWGIAANSPGAGSPVEIASIPGTVVTTNSDLSGDAVGDLVYLLETDNVGLVGTTAPSTSGAVQYEVGRVHTVGGAGVGRIIFQPRFVRVNP